MSVLQARSLTCTRTERKYVQENVTFCKVVYVCKTSEYESYHRRERDPTGWSTVLVTALGSWGDPVPRGHQIYHTCALETSPERKAAAAKLL